MRNESSVFAGLVLAAGKGTRFRDESGGPFPKVLRPILGKPMVTYVIETLREAGISNITLIVGFQADEVRAAVGESVGYVVQEEQKGSGHAVACARGKFEGFDGHLIVMCGDSPLFTRETVRRMMAEHHTAAAAVTLASATLPDPTGYGRILRDESGRITGVVEEKCATEQRRAIREVNGGVYAFDSPWLLANIDRIAMNDAGEYNLTDMVRVAIEQGRTVSWVECDPWEVLGVNSPEDLRAVEELMRGK